MESKGYTNRDGGGAVTMNSTEGRIIYNIEDSNSMVMTTRIAASEIFSKISNSREEQEFDVSIMIRINDLGCN